MGISEIITKRKSVRTYASDIGESEKQDIIAFASSAFEPYGVDIEYRVLDAKEHGLSSPVLSGEKLYVAGMVAKMPNAEVAYGYAFEKLVLYAWSLGIGTTWIGGTMKREVFEKAAGVGEGELMPCVSPLGYPAKKRSIKEAMMRKGVGADNRLPAEKIFFDGAWDKGLSMEKQIPMANLIEMVRWAPSAVNKQPWRVIVTPDACHIYEKKDKGYVGEKTGDLQKIDVGIALCHLVMGLEEQGIIPAVTVEDPGFAIPEGAEYIATVRKA